MIVNNSFSVKFLPKNAWNRIFGKVQFQNYPPVHQDRTESGLDLIYTACYAVMGAVKTSA